MTCRAVSSCDPQFWVRELCAETETEVCLCQSQSQSQRGPLTSSSRACCLAFIRIMVIGDGKSRPSRRGNSKDEPTSPASPLARFPPLPPAESRSRAPEFYGFVAWAVTYLLFVLYFLWAILPDEWIIWLGVSWYPNRCVSPPQWRGLVHPLQDGRVHVTCCRRGGPFRPDDSDSDSDSNSPTLVENGHFLSRHGRS